MENLKYQRCHEKKRNLAIFFVKYTFTVNKICFIENYDSFHSVLLQDFKCFQKIQFFSEQQ